MAAEQKEPGFAIFTTAFGDIKIKLRRDAAPVTCAAISNIIQAVATPPLSALTSCLQAVRVIDCGSTNLTEWSVVNL